MRHLFSRLQANRRAVVAVEFAVVAPIMVLLAGAIFEIGSLLRTSAAVNRLTMQYAVSYADCSDTASGVCLTELDEYPTTAALGNIAPQLKAASVTLKMAQVKMNGLVPTIEYIYPTGSSLTNAQTAALQAAIPSGQSGIVITISYPYRLLVFSSLMSPFIGSSFTFSYTAAQLK